ncbi:hypothetical protein BDN70DRAFT_873849 [Pholiota conissans]|uniref:Uncharacterized protein n=1 Tax=Pholiota conissans TaxID=109636 RepID=A0A9P6CXZ9_9AGAR|nr:hypothetical protein BDN70DRAFT_873849 [Pholiota conissans]
MERLCDEILQLIFYELTDPSPITQVSRRFQGFSQDPYVRAHYFLVHYGPIEAMYNALGRGKVLNDRVLDILLTSGAHLSRYLIQIAIHHYFYTQAHFIKTQWVRNVPLRVFAYFLKLAEEKYGEIPRGKGEDDGSLFTTFLKENRLSTAMKTVTWEVVRTLLDTYNFIPFCNRDPIMSQFPLALAIEPRLLPYAVKNGFSMDYKYRDFVFRKMFERPPVSSETRAEDIADNVRELCNLDSAMFVSRTVAAEICMEAKVNEIGYAALKELDKSGHLRFELSTLVEDLLMTFLTTRSISSVSTGDILLHLFSDFPSTDVSVRLVILVVVFIAAENLHMTHTALRAKLEALNVGPIKRRDVVNILINPFVECYNAVINFARQEVSMGDDGPKGLSPQEIDAIVEEVAGRCLEIACKGKLLKIMAEGFPHLKQCLTQLVLQKYQIKIDEVPSWEDEGSDCEAYVAKLCRDFLRFGVGEVHTLESLQPEDIKLDAPDLKCSVSSNNEAPLRTLKDTFVQGDKDASELGEISQESLSTMIRHDEVTPVRSRRRIMYSYGISDAAGKYRYPQDSLHVGKWIKACFGPRSSVTAIFMTHAVINDNCSILHHYLMANDDSTYQLNNNVSTHVPVTLKHFQLLAALGRTPNFYMWQHIEIGAEFFFDEKDYLNSEVKVEPTHSAISSEASIRPVISSNRNKKRPRRTATTTVRSYAVPDSDEEDKQCFQAGKQQDKNPRETNLQLWIKHLGILLKMETRKHNLIKKCLEKAAAPDTKVRIQKNDFVKSLNTNLRTLRKLEAEIHHSVPFVEEYDNDQNDDEYMLKRTKRRRSNV